MLHAGVICEGGGKSVMLQAHVLALHLPYFCGCGPCDFAGALPSSGASSCLPVPHGQFVHFFGKRTAAEPLAQVGLL
jgi:hypothetical protein